MGRWTEDEDRRGAPTDGNAGAVVRGPGGNIAYGRGADDAL